MTPVAGGLGLSLVIVGGFFAFYFIVVSGYVFWLQWFSIIFNDENNSDGQSGTWRHLWTQLDCHGSSKKECFLLVNGWVQLWMKRCGNDFNTPSCWSRLDNLACNDNNNTNIFEENDGSLDKIYFNSTCWYSPRLIYDDDSYNDSRHWQ